MIGGFRNKRSKQRNLRKKIETTGSDDEEDEVEEMAIDSPVVAPTQPAIPLEVHQVKVKSNMKKSASALSFGDELDEPEEFVVRRSKASVNMHDQVRKEKKKKKKKNNKGEQDEEVKYDEAKEIESENIRPPSTASFQIKTFDDEEEVDSDSDVSHRFSSQSRFGMPGDIPDAATIYAMKKKREQARQFSGQPDYIPMNTVRYEGRFKNSDSRLVREELDSSDEERIEMKGKQTYNAVLERRKQVAKALEEVEENDEDNNEEEQDEEVTNWENEQIKKGSKHHATILERYGPTLPSTANSHQYGEPNLSKAFSMPTNDQQIMSVDFVTKRLSERLDTKKQLNRLHAQELVKLRFDLDSTTQNISTLQEKAAQLEEKFSFFQDIRGFAKDLIECLDEKVKKIKSLEETMHSSLKKRNGLITNRRQNDVKDETEEISGKSMSDSGRIANVRNRRIAEREARRTRRRERRQSTGGSNHFDGQSSDDELIPSDLSKFKADREKVVNETEAIFSDTVSTFSSVKEILSRFELWKFGFDESYKESYLGLCLPKLLAPFIKLEFLMWNPLEKNNDPDFEDMKWFQSVAMYGYHGDKIEDGDSDLNLLPVIVEKILIPKLNVIVQDVWDPLSRQQTKLLTFLFQRLVDDYPTVSKESKAVQVR